MTGPQFIGGPIWTHDKGGGTLFMAGIREYEGHSFLDLRIWTGHGKTATRKGATIPLDGIASFQLALATWVSGIAPNVPEDGF